MKNLKDICYNDAQMYYTRVLALDKADGSALEVSIIPAEDLGRYEPAIKQECKRLDGRYARREWYVGLSTEIGGRTRRIILPEKLEKDYHLSKFPLGWLNYPNGAFYLSSTSERTVRKGHRTDRIHVTNVYYDALHSEYSKLCVKLDRERDHGSGHGKVEKQLNALHNALRRHNVSNNNTSYYVQHVIGTLGNPTFFSLEEAQEKLLTRQPKVHSVALSREFAVSLCSQFHTNSTGLYFHMKMIGYMDKDGLHVFKAFSGMLPQIQRVLHVQGVEA